MARVLALLGLLCASCSAFVAGGRASAPIVRRAATSALPTTQMVVEPHAVDAATQLMAYSTGLSIPIAEYSPAKVSRLLQNDIVCGHRFPSATPPPHSASQPVIRTGLFGLSMKTS